MELKQEIQKAIDAKDIEKVFSFLPVNVRRHSERVGKVAEIIYRKCLELRVYEDQDLKSEYLPLINNVCRYHDIGKIYSKKHWFEKMTKLSEKEIEEIKEHAFNSSLVFEPCLEDANVSLEITLAADVAMAHHENYDGSGYPCNWESDFIPLIARICAIANFYDHLVNPTYANERTYRHFETLDEITSLSKTKFDPLLVQIFIDCNEEIEEEIQKFTYKETKKLKKAKPRKKIETKYTSPFLFNLRPIYHIDTNKANLLELVLELKDEKIGILKSSKYVRIAEKSNRIFAIDDFAIKHAIDYVKVLRNKFLSDCLIELEVSYRQLQNDAQNKETVTKLVDFIKRNPGFKNHICLTFDSYAFYDGRVNKNMIDLLKEEGVYICLKERNSIHNLTTILQLYDFDYLKINESLVKNISFNEKEKMIFIGVIDMVRKFGVQPIIENIKSNMNLAHYKEAHIELLEGPYYRKEQKTISAQLLNLDNSKGELEA